MLARIRIGCLGEVTSQVPNWIGRSYVEVIGKDRPVGVSDIARAGTLQPFVLFVQQSRRASVSKSGGL